MGSPGQGSSEYERSQVRTASYLGYCLLAVILFGCYVLFNRFQDDNSANDDRSPLLDLMNCIVCNQAVGISNQMEI